jgi:FAD/FMN-containing dehydrogenase
VLESRRDFLSRSLRWGAGAGALFAGGLLEGCAQSPTTTTTTLAAPRPASDLDWRRLGARLRGTLVRPTTPSYARDVLLFDAALAPRHPQGIAYCESNDDVARCVAFAREHALAITTRSGGHSYAGYSSNDGLVVDLSRLNAVRVDSDANVALVGAGTQLIDLYDSLAAHGRLVPGGSCATVGIAGLALGGGIGVLARRYGLTCDNILEATMVRADASLVHVDASSEPDLLWAHRGGGGGNFGVTTSFTLRTHEIPPLALFTLHFDWAAARDVVMAWMSWIPTQADDLWTNCLLQSEGVDGLSLEVSGVWCGSASALSQVVDSFVSAVGTAPTSRFVAGDNYLDAMAAEAGCSSLSIAACHLSGDGVGQLSRAAFRAKSSFVVAPWSPARVERAVASLAHLAGRAPDLGAALAFDSYGGAISRVTSRESAFAHHGAIAGIQATHSWSTYSPQSQIDAGDEWLDELGSSVFVAGDGAYVNYIDPTLTNWLDAYYGASVERLVRVKSTIDPDDLFHFAQSIPLRLPAPA